jgi:hypothetical protein
VTPDPRDLDTQQQALANGIAVVLAALVLTWLVALTVAGVRWLLL